jgi:DNA-binding PadR family transcriptional regulator
LKLRGATDPLLLILVSLAGGAKHGHAMLLDVESFAGVRMGPGTLYGAITRLEEDGLIEALPAEGRRRPYRLTSSGHDVLVTRLAVLVGTVRTALERVAT